MNYWILPWNKDVFDLHQCLTDFGYAEWRQMNKLAVGDIVFLYCSSPVQQIVYMMRVAKTDIPRTETINDEYLNGYKYNLKASDYYARLEPIAKAEENNPALSYSRLKELGITSKLQGGNKVSDDILNHLLENFDVVFDDLSQTYTEGKAHNTSITTYERNQKAREVCLRKYGNKCQICDLILEQKYGPVGKEFIHVHHINFISSSDGKSRQVNPETDLIPVCPYCHAMLHRRIDGKYLSPTELKELISEYKEKNTCS